MRSNIFLHFLNRDSREIYGLYKAQPEAEHRTALLQATNAAVLLCEDHCVIPPGFAVECDIAFSLLTQQSAYLRENLIQMPMREASLSEFAEKKRIEYAPMRRRYRGLFNDRRLNFLAENAAGLIPRTAKIAEAISKGWSAAPDAKSKIWTPVKEKVSSRTIEVVRAIPEQLINQETAATWSAIEPLLPREALAAADSLRNSLQHVYFKAYMDEFRLIVLRGAPLMHLDFMLRSEDYVYSYERFRRYLRAFHLHEILLNGSADFISALKPRAGAIRFFDAYAELGRYSKRSLANVEFAAGLVAEEVKFDWSGFARQHQSRANWSEMEVLELADALNEAGGALQQRYGFRIRAPGRSALSGGGLLKLRIAFLSASPFDEESVTAGEYRISTDKEYRDLEQHIKSLRDDGRVDLKLFPAADFSALLRALNQFRPHVVHFSGHAGKKGIVMETSSIQDTGGVPVEFGILARALSATAERPQLVVLNACDTVAGARKLLEAVPVVIAMSEPIGDEAAYEFSQKFYGALCMGQSIGHAKEQACAFLQLTDEDASALPTILSRDGVNPAGLTLIS